MAKSALYNLEPLVASISTVLQAESLDRIARATEIGLQQIGFDGFCVATKIPKNGWVSDPDLTNWPEASRAEYVREKFYLCDPAIVAVLSGEPSFTWHSRKIYHRRDWDRFMGFVDGTTTRSGCVINIKNSLFGRGAFVASLNAIESYSPEIIDAVSMFGSAVALGLTNLRTRVSREDRKRPPQLLTVRQHDIVRWIAEGKTNYEIGTILGLTVRNVVYHVSEILRKTDLRSRSQIVAWYLRNCRNRNL